MGKPTPCRAGNQRPIVWALLSIVAAACAVLAGFVWWRATNIDYYGRIPRPAVAVQIPMLTFQTMGRRNGLHCVCYASSPWRFALQFEPKTYLHEPGYRRAKYASAAGFGIAVLSHRLEDSDSILSPFAALILPHWFVVVFFALLLFLFLVRWRQSTRGRRDERQPEVSGAG